jgi:hypothetical protein
MHPEAHAGNKPAKNKFKIHPVKPHQIIAEDSHKTFLKNQPNSV